MYITHETELAIQQYNDVNTPKHQREKIYERDIYPALKKLVENIIHNRKLYEYGDDDYEATKLDCVCYLTERLNKFNPVKGKKAFSYFNRVAINYLIANKRKIETKKNSKDILSKIDSTRDVISEQYNLNYKEEISEFIDIWADWCIENIDTLFTKKKEQRVADAILNLFKYRRGIDNYNKKALYIMIREQVNVQTQHITQVSKQLKYLYTEMLIEYRHSGTRKFKYFLIKEEEI